MKPADSHLKRPVVIRFAILMALLAAVSLAIANADRGDAQAQVWAADPKLTASLQKPAPFDVYTIRLPQGFSFGKDDSFKDARRSEFNGQSRPDGSEPTINVWIAQLTPDQAAADPIALGLKLIEASDRDGASDFVRLKSETGMINGNWVTRFYDTCQVQAGNLKVDIRAVNFVWIDNGRLVMVNAYDAVPNVKQSLPLLEASVYTIAPAAANAGGLGSIVPQGGL
jgi:hypothetical protein